jgi:hypothetical protein
MLCCGCKQQVYVICHQAPGVKAALVSGGLFCEGFQEIPVVTVFMETGYPVVTSLDDVPGYAREREAGAAWHDEVLRSMDTANSLPGCPACISRWFGIVPVR